MASAAAVRAAPQNAFSFPLFSALGIRFEVNVTFIVLTAWVMLSLYSRGHDAKMALYALILVGVVFSCILVHELGHVLVARLFGIRTTEITLTATGGHAHLETLPDAPSQEMLIALSGPAVNLLIGGAVFLYLKLFGNVPAPAEFTNLNANPLGQFMWLNLTLGFTNLLPLFPLDGGRILRAFLGFFVDYPRATKVATIISRVLAIPIAIYGMRGQPLYLLVAVWVWLGARSASDDAKNRYALKSYRVKEIMVTDFSSLRIDESLRDAAAAFVRTFQEEFPVMNGSEVVGMVDFKALTRAIEEHGLEAQVSRAMRIQFQTTTAEATLEEVIQALDAHEEKVALVKDADRVIGLIPRSNLHELVKVQHALGVV